MIDVTSVAINEEANEVIIKGVDLDSIWMFHDEPEEDANQEEQPSEDAIEEPIEDASTSNENSSEEQLDEDDETEDNSTPKKSYFFLKITLR